MLSQLIENREAFFDGFWLTLQICMLSAVGALFLGTAAAVMRISPLPSLRWAGTAYVTTVRNAPLTAIFIFVGLLPLLGSDASFLKIPGLDTVFRHLGIDLPYFRFAIVALSIYTGAFVCEALRSGVNAVPAGQAEAARAIGLTFSQNVRYVVMPQAWKAAIVPLGSVLIAMIKNSALAGFFGLVGDLSQKAQDLITASGEDDKLVPVIPVFIGISIGFLVMTVPLGILLDRVEARRAVAR